jgi:hypothetical protein
MPRTVRLLLAALLAVAGAAVAVPALATEGYCGLAWGSVAESAPALGSAPLQSVRTGRHGCWDRVVFEVDGPAAGYTVGYVTQVVQDGSGAVLPVPGGARLQVQLNHPAYDAAGAATYPHRAGTQVANVAGYSTLRSVVYGGSFEGYTTFGVGTRAHLPFRVFTLDGPGGRSRIVVDVAHRWS